MLKLSKLSEASFLSKKKKTIFNIVFLLSVTNQREKRWNGEAKSDWSFQPTRVFVLCSYRFIHRFTEMTISFFNAIYWDGQSITDIQLVSGKTRFFNFFFSCFSITLSVIGMNPCSITGIVNDSVNSFINVFARCVSYDEILHTIFQTFPKDLSYIQCQSP